ncbi:MAG: sensor histidine kinase, partial [Bdellovibrionota bacterium]
MTEERLREFFAVLERMAAGEVRLRLPITPERDTLDAIAFGVNMMAAELHHTEQELKKARDAAIVANQAKSAYIANLSHEIRTPMTAIMGYLQLVTHFDFSEEKKRDCLVRAEASCKMLLRLIDDALDLAKVESGKFMMEYSLISPANAIREVVASLESIAVIKNVKVEVILSKEVPKEFKTDPLRFKQILVNLLGNAIKFTTEGGIRVLVDGLAGDDSMLVVDVVDTGLGIEPGKLEQLFKPFNQLDSPVAKKLGGSGLGLALSRRFAQSLGGDLALLTSAPGKGSTFRLTLPVLRRDSSDIPSQQFFAAGSYQSIRGTLEGV